MRILRQSWDSPMVIIYCQENVSKASYQNSDAFGAVLVRDRTRFGNSPKVVCYGTNGLVWLKLAWKCAKE